MPDWLTKLLEQWAVVTAAPIPFLITVLAATVIIWFAMDWRYGGVIGHRDSEISSLKTQRDEYKNKSGGASPDEVKAKLSELSEMTRFTVGGKWRPLTAGEASELRKGFSAIPAKRIQVMYSNYRGKDLAQSFADILKDAGWTDIHFSEGGGLGYGVSTGRGKGTAVALKTAIEKATEFKVSSLGPEEPEFPNAYFIAVGINSD